MVKIAIVGANGQVGAELCLMLTRRDDLTLVPICRNRSGSAFLRWKGIACRHGRVADAVDARRLLSDCDVVVNCSLATGTPAEIRRVEASIVNNTFAHSKPGAVVIHFSTQSVYGDPRRGRWIRWRNPYGRAKLATEQRVRDAQRHFKKPAFILRLGHVCGVLQDISNTIRAQIATGSVFMPVRDRSSNTVYTAAIVGAVIQIVGGGTEPGTYDLMNTPRWSWKEVYEFEGIRSGIDFSPTLIDISMGSAASGGRGSAVKLAGFLASKPWIRDALSKLFAHIPDAANARGQAWWYMRRARTEIGALAATRTAAEHLSWVENGERFFPAMSSTKDLLSSTPSIRPESAPVAPWPSDLPDADSRPSQ